MKKKNIAGNVDYVPLKQLSFLDVLDKSVKCFRRPRVVVEYASFGVQMHVSGVVFVSSVEFYPFWISKNLLAKRWHFQQGKELSIRLKSAIVRKARFQMKKGAV